MESNNSNSDFIRARATFQDKTKMGDDKITLILGQGDAAQLLEALQNTPSAEGVKVDIFLKPYNGKTLGSIKISDGTRKQGGGAPAPKAFAPKSFAFKPKK